MSPISSPSPYSGLSEPIRCQMPTFPKPVTETFGVRDSAVGSGARAGQGSVNSAGLDSSCSRPHQPALVPSCHPCSAQQLSAARVPREESLEDTLQTLSSCYPWEWDCGVGGAGGRGINQEKKPEGFSFWPEAHQ